MFRHFRRVLTAITLGTLHIGVAQAQVETVVVTSERAEGDVSGIFIVKRADHLISTVVVTCDTRDANQRRKEMKDTLRDMLRAAAATSTISLGVGDRMVDKLTESDLDDIIVPDTRPDTSRATIVVKTAISPTDTINAAIARVTDFIKRTAVIGRTEVKREGDWGLAIVAPEQYRDAILAKVVEDAKHAEAQFGADYGVTIEGLERPVQWFQKGPLDLGLYISYSLKIGPLGK
jgi:hypothetical protein